MGFIADFKAFALKGNVLDLAIGVVIGAAFGKIVAAIVDDVIMPLLGLITRGKRFDDLIFVLPGKDGVRGEYNTLAEAKAAGANVLAYGHLLQTVVDFILIAFCIFLVIRGVAKLYNKKEREVLAAPPPAQEVLLTEIRDILKSRAN